MPLEVTPVPFVEQQLPYNPKFIREPEADLSGEGSLPGGGGGSVISGPGPLAAAASALIAPAPGGIAGPHNAIPALPEAGYTAPGIRTTGLGLDLGGGSSARSSLSDGYGPMGPGSMMRPGAHAASGFAPDAFGHPPRAAPPAPMSTISSHSWIGGSSQNTFPGPRRASNPALVPSLAESTIAPRGVSQHGGHAIDPRHHDQLDVPAPHGHHHTDRHRRSHSGPREHRSDNDDWDARSDASYYARPKPARARSGSTLSDITSSTSTARPPSAQYHHSLHQGQKGSPGQHEHSPISPSPLARDSLPHQRHAHSQPGPSPLSPTAHVGTRHARKISGVDTDRDGVPPPTQPSPYRRVTPIAPDLGFAPGDLGPLREASERGGRRYSHSYGSDTGPDRGRRGAGSPQGYASDDEGRYSSRSRGTRADKSRRRHDDAVTSHHSISRRGHKHVAEAYPDDEYESHQHQHQHRSLSRVPPPMQYRAPSPASLQVPHQHGLPDIASLSISGESRRRAQSLQQAPAGLPISSPASLAGFGGGAAYASGPYQTPSAAGGAEIYDDGGSVAGSAMTFMDGAVAGRTSHYGLPKYPHQAKPDYRRFMVQRGKAEVYLD